MESRHNLIAPPSPRWARLLIVVLGVLIGTLRLYEHAPVAPLERLLYDSVFAPLLPSPPKSERIAIVAVDDEALNDLNESWPISRRTWANFLQKLNAYEPAAVVFDVVFDQPSQTVLHEFVDALTERLHDETELRTTVVDLVEEVALSSNADRIFAQTLANSGSVTLGMVFSEDERFLDPSMDLHPLVTGLEPGTLAFEMQGVTVSTPALYLAAQQHGALNVRLEHDAVVRRYPYMVQMRGKALPSLALAAALAVTTEPQARQELLAKVQGADRGMPLLRYRSPKDEFPHLSFSDILMASGSAESNDGLKDFLKGKIVFVGTTALGIKDFVRTPQQLQIAGVGVHASALENLETESWLESEGLAQVFAGAFALLFLGSYAALLERRVFARRLWWSAIALLACHILVTCGIADVLGLFTGLSVVPIGLGVLSLQEAFFRWWWARREALRLRERERVLQAERDTLERFRGMVEHVGDAIVSVDAKRSVRWMNPAAESLFRRRAGPLIGTSLDALVTELKPQTGFGNVLAAEALVQDEVIPIEVTETDMTIAGERYTNYVLRDVTRRKALEKQREEFIASVNHELRTPITSILGSLRLVNQGALGPIPPQMVSLLGIAEKNGERLLGMVSDLLEAAKIDAGRMTLDKKPTPVLEFLDDVVMRNLGFGAHYQVAVKRYDPCDVATMVLNIDRERLGQVLANFVSNAVKHSPSQQTVWVGAHLCEDGFVRLWVRDHGPGLTQEAGAKLFERFSMQVAADGKKRAGTGLGLAIAKGLVEAHDGRIGFESEPGVATTFWCELKPLD